MPFDSVNTQSTSKVFILLFSIRAIVSLIVSPGFASASVEVIISLLVSVSPFTATIISYSRISLPARSDSEFTSLITIVPFASLYPSSSSALRIAVAFE